MELSTISREIYLTGKRLERGVKELFQFAKEKAETERDYRRELAIETMRLKNLEGKEKMSITLIPDVARGNLAELKFKRDLAEAKYTSARDSLQAIRQQMNGLQTIVKFQSEIEDDPGER